MCWLRRILRGIVLTLVISSIIIVELTIPVHATTNISLSQEEIDYIGEGKTLKAVSIDGGAPLHYTDSKGRIKGIAVSVLQEISDMTGIIFDYYLFDSVSQALNSDYDLVFGLSKEYKPAGIILSKSYLESETVLCFNKSLDPKKLDNKKYAGIRGGSLPEGIKEENTIYYNDREDTVSAVNSGQADYCLGNAYSLAFYSLQNSYKNIITIPSGKGEREYCMGVDEEDKILLSIINKSIDAIDPKRMDMLILELASQVERQITFSMIIDAYGKEIFILTLLIIISLLYSVFSSINAKNRYKVENRRYQIITQVSNECLFEYRIDTNHLDISHKFNEIFGYPDQKDEIINLLGKTFARDFHLNLLDKNIHTIRLELSNGKLIIFKLAASILRDESGKVFSIIGKLSDISKEVAEKEELITKSQLDGLTGLYNAITSKEHIIKSINSKKTNSIDALIILDCDNFKAINDSYGHLGGDLVLQKISQSLSNTFRQSDIIGRIGGDEFCIYMHDIPSADFAFLKCQQLVESIESTDKKYNITVSIGIAVLIEEIAYDDLFQRADSALYRAKNYSGSKIIVYNQ